MVRTSFADRKVTCLPKPHGLAPIALLSCLLAVPCAAGGDHAPAAGSAVLQVSEDVVHYPVSGNSERALREQLRHDLLPDAAGSSHGRTRSDIELSYEAFDDAGECRPKHLQIKLQITTTLPQWTPEADVDPELQSRWDRAYAALERHEAVHREHALEAARGLKRRIAQLQPMSDCRALRRAINRALYRVTTKCELDDDLFDMRTRKGYAEQAEF